MTDPLTALKARVAERKQNRDSTLPYSAPKLETPKSEGFIFLLNAGTQSFQDGGHFQNFLKYLFSCSKSHQENENTKNNCYFQDPSKGDDGCTFVDNGQTNYNAFKNKWWNETKDVSTLLNNLHYIPFAIGQNGKLYSNFLTIDEQTNSIKITLEEGMINAIINHYFAGDGTNFSNALHRLHKEYGEFIPFDNCPLNDRVLIEKKIHSSLEDTIEPSNLLISISHTDQDSLYHIHRILKTKGI